MTASEMVLLAPFAWALLIVTVLFVKKNDKKTLWLYRIETLVSSGLTASGSVLLGLGAMAIPFLLVTIIGFEYALRQKSLNRKGLAAIFFLLTMTVSTFTQATVFVYQELNNEIRKELVGRAIAYEQDGVRTINDKLTELRSNDEVEVSAKIRKLESIAQQEETGKFTGWPGAGPVRNFIFGFSSESVDWAEVIARDEKTQYFTDEMAEVELDSTTAVDSVALAYNKKFSYSIQLGYANLPTWNGYVSMIKHYKKAITENYWSILAGMIPDLLLLLILIQAPKLKRVRFRKTNKQLKIFAQVATGISILLTTVGLINFRASLFTWCETMVTVVGILLLCLWIIERFQDKVLIRIMSNQWAWVALVAGLQLFAMYYRSIPSNVAGLNKTGTESAYNEDMYNKLETFGHALNRKKNAMRDSLNEQEARLTEALFYAVGGWAANTSSDVSILLPAPPVIEHAQMAEFIADTMYSEAFQNRVSSMSNTEIMQAVDSANVKFQNARDRKAINGSKGHLPAFERDLLKAHYAKRFNKILHELRGIWQEIRDLSNLNPPNMGQATIFNFDNKIQFMNDESQKLQLTTVDGKKWSYGKGPTRHDILADTKDRAPIIFMGGSVVDWFMFLMSISTMIGMIALGGRD